VPQLVRVQTWFADRDRGSIEGGITDDRTPPGSAGTRAREHEVTGLLPGNVLLELVEEGQQYRDLATLMTFRRPEYEIGAHNHN
jgi:hypothetical protein